jgi:hypothetical protein
MRSDSVKHGFPLMFVILAAMVLASLRACSVPVIAALPPVVVTPPVVLVSARVAPGDSVVFVASWTAPARNARQYPIAGYQVQWLLDGQAQVTNQATGTRDSVKVAKPPLGETLGPMRVSVRSRDSQGTLSNPTLSDPFTLTTTPEPPSPPGPVQVDTVGTPVAQVIVAPQSVSLSQLGKEVQLCALAQLADSTWAIDPYTIYCQAQLDSVRGTTVGQLAQKFAYWR